jgi:hypothetical protein
MAPFLPLLAALLAPPAGDSSHASPYADCGLPPRAVSTRYSDDLEEDEVTIRVPSRSVSDAALGCMVQASQRTGGFLVFTDSRLARRYWRAHRAVDQAAGLATARSWLEAKGKLRSLPVFDPRRHTLIGFAHEIERFCGLEEGSFFTLGGDRFLTVKPMALDDMLAIEDGFACATNALAASNLSEHGFRFGFIGNQAFASTPHRKRRR